MLQFRSIFLLVLPALSACQPALESGAQRSTVALPVDAQRAASESADSERSRERAAEIALPAGYASARAALLGAGWLPLRDPECWTKVGGRAEVCNVLPETEACSSDGHCVVHFGHIGQAKLLRVTIYGDWAAPDLARAEGLEVKSSQESPVAATPSLACPASTFEGFLAAFAADEATRVAFTAPLVRVAELNSTDEGDVPRAVLIPGDVYAGFNVRHGNGAFHHVDAWGKVDPAPLPLDVKRADETYEVRYHYGMSEGNSYAFEAHEGCWRLVADPEPPAP
ncbi:hypothetical protein [Luteimonas deserti]|uniref:Uncharacterized protein n=1 Tax=Luteimonas deserti TaxID=2752306 RepID=A0A7Z0U0E0_9GAMM|nr:hypothetical protein [Luteimonas deserti]NYZ63188.1 hypothetical protein [Luteimonas deserti]